MTTQSRRYGRRTIPRLDNVNLGAAAFAGQSNGRRFRGFSKNGDYIVLNLTTTGNIEYYNNAHTLQWSKALTTLQAAADYYGGFYLDETDALLYVVTLDFNTSPKTYQLHTINAAGTVSSKTAFQPTANFSGGLTYTDALTGTGSLWREDGTGNLRLSYNSAGTYGAEYMDITTAGAKVNDPASFTVQNGTKLSGAHYKTASGVWAALGSGSNLYKQLVLYKSGSDVVSYLDWEAADGSPSGSTGGGFQAWGDKVYFRINSGSSNCYVPCVWDRGDFEAWVDLLADRMGM